MEKINYIPVIDVANSETKCCGLLDKNDWDMKVFTLEDMLFAKAEVKSFFYMPLNFSKVYSKAFDYISKAEAEMGEGYLTLSKDVSPWKSEHYFRVNKSVPGLEMVRLSGTFITKVYDGKFKDVPKFIKDINEKANAQGHKIEETYVFYTMCPKCSSHYKHNYMVLFGKISK